jgi:hypothetical protein
LKNEKSNIAIFDTFKTRNDKFTGEARRQRGIIIHLAIEKSAELRTRTSIAHAIAKNNGILWQNIYSGIFRDLDEVLIPSGVVIEEGRLPLRRGPKALQLEGVPFYELTETGILVASSIEELGDYRMKLLESYISSLNVNTTEELIMKNGLILLLKVTPQFASKIISEYVYDYSTGIIDTATPIDITRMRPVIGDQILIEKELIEAYSIITNEQQQLMRNFFKVMT